MRGSSRHERPEDLLSAQACRAVASARGRTRGRPATEGHASAAATQILALKCEPSREEVECLARCGRRSRLGPQWSAGAPLLPLGGERGGGGNCSSVAADPASGRRGGRGRHAGGNHGTLRSITRAHVRNHQWRQRK